jgi:uncharacterized protein
MLKVIVDTNVLVSSLIQTGYPFLIIQFLIKNKKIKLCISDLLMEEYRDVLSRKKFSRYPSFVENSEGLLSDIEERAQKYYPNIKVKIIKDDADNRLLELAETCKADYLITGNTRHFPMGKYKSTKIISPKEFCELEIL